MTTSHAGRDPVELLAEEFRERFRRGERPDVDDYTRRYPDLAEEIRELFPALVLMEELKPAASDLTGAYAGAATLAQGKVLERLGDYRILREIGRGGMGIVYEAEQESLGRHVALKVLPAQALLDPQQQKRFQREAKAAARMHHTNIVPVYGVGECDGMHYYVMQYIQGLGLDQVLAELSRLRREQSAARGRGPATVEGAAVTAPSQPAVRMAESLLSGQFALKSDGGRPASPAAIDPAYAPTATSASRPAPEPPPAAPAPPPGSRDPAASSSSGPAAQVLSGQVSRSALSESGRHYWLNVARIGLQVAEALEYAHGQGVLHRDIKPSNLLLDTQATVWVTDFGLAKAEADGDDLTHTGDIVGTLRYMAPERFNGQSDARGDLYSLGLTLYELAVHRPAFEESDRNRLIHQVTHAAPARPRKLNPAVPRDLETIILKATDREPARRYASATALAEDLRRFLDDKPVLARRAGVPERLWRWARRNPAVASLSGTVALLLLVMAVTGLFLAAHFRGLAEQERRAHVATAEARERAEAQKQLADANFRQARQAVDDSLTQISEAALLNVPGLQPLRRQLLESALRYYTDFARQRADDPDLQKDLATAYARVGKITAEIGSKADALTAYQQALAIRAMLREADPGDPGPRAELARLHQAAGALQRDLGETDDALRSLLEASAILQDVLKQNKDNVELLGAFAGVLTDLGLTYLRKSEPLEALSYYTSAVNLQRRLVEENPGHPRAVELRYALALQLGRTGTLQGDIDIFTEALKLHGEALTLLKGLVRDHPRHERFPDFQRALAATHESIAAVQEKTDRLPEALQSYAAALRLREPLARDNPAVTDYQGELAQGYFALGLLQARTGQPADAVESFRRAIDRQRRVVAAVPSSVTFTRALGRQLARLGEVQVKLERPAEALASYQEARSFLEQQPASTPEDFFERACVRAACSGVRGAGPAASPSEEQARQKQDADQAVALLRRAVEAGYRDAEEVRRNPAFDGLRSREDFRTALSAVEERARALVWTGDLAAAKAQALREKKDLFIYFTGSDWCPWCILVRRDVLGKDAFLDYAAKHYVMVELDFPQYKERPKEYPQNEALFRRWGLPGYPSLILADARGRAYGNLREGNTAETVEGYQQHMARLRDNRLRRDELLTKAEAAEGLERARLLDQALSLIPTAFVDADYSDLAAEVRRLDADNRAGLRDKYVASEVRQRRVDVEATMKKCDWDGTIKKLDAILAELKPTGGLAADMLADRARAEAELNQLDQALADLTKAVELKPDDAALWLQRGQLHARMEHGRDADADLARALELRAKAVERCRRAFDQAPHVLANREALSNAYMALGEAQRQFGRHAAAAATALERAELWPGEAVNRYNVACELALCAALVRPAQAQRDPDDAARRSRYADQAMEFLREAVTLGFADGNHVRQDDDLTALRERDDYRALVAAMTLRSKFPTPIGALRRFTGHQHKWVESAALSADGRLALSGGFDQVLILWDVRTGREVRRFTGHTGAVHSVALSADAARALSGGADQAVRLWDVATGKEVRRLAGHTAAVRSVAFAPDGRRGLSAGNDGTVCLWDLEDGREIRRFAGHAGPVAAVAFAADGRRFVSGGEDGTVRLWDVEAGTELRRFAGPEDHVLCVALAPDGRRALSGTESGFLHVWDVESGRSLHRLEGHWNAVRSACFSADGRQALSGSRGEMILWDPEAGRERFRLRMAQTFNSVAFTPDGGHALSATTDGVVRLWTLSEDAARARALALTGRLPEALAVYAQAIDRRPADPDLPLERALLRARQREWQPAVEDFTRALEGYQRHDLVPIFRAWCHAELQQWDQVAADFGRAMDWRAETPDPRADRGQLHAELLQWEAAFAKVLELRPDDAELWIVRGRRSADRGEWARAAADYAKAAQLRPGDALLARIHAALCRRAGDADGYRRCCERMLERFRATEDPAVAAELVIACTRGPKAAGDPEELIRLARNAVEADPRSGRRHHALASAYYRAGRFDDAARCLRAALDAEPGWDGRPLNWLLLALTHRRLDQPDEAKRWLDSAQKAYASQTKAHRGATVLLTPTWWDWVDYQVLRAEADETPKGNVARLSE